jgi:hypothetical protein
MTSKCPICKKELELISKPGDPTRVQGFCNHGDVRLLMQPVIEMDAEPKETVKQPQKERKAK